MYNMIIKPSYNISEKLRTVIPPPLLLYFMSHLGIQLKITLRKQSNFHYSNKKCEIIFNVISKEYVTVLHCII